MVTDLLAIFISLRKAAKLVIIGPPSGKYRFSSGTMMWLAEVMSGILSFSSSDKVTSPSSRI